MKNSPFIPAKGAPQETETQGENRPDVSAFASHTHDLTIAPWLPDAGDFVLCVFLANGGGDGFVIGGI
jgi:hypothetical protein